METDAPCDVVVVGAGASGLPAAWRLAWRGLSVVVLDQGGWTDYAASPSLDHGWERALQQRFHPDPNVRRLPEDYPVDVSATPIRPATYNGVGGATLRWGAQFPRLRPSDFRVRSLDGVAEDWPIGYRGRASEAMRAAGALSVTVNPLVAAAGFHLLGTARMGSDPRRSVVGADCRAHQVPNLAIVDGAVFVTGGVVNPTSTLQANALRVADALADRLCAA